MTLTISKTKLKTHMLRIFRELEENGDDLIVTDRDRPILRVVQFQEKRGVDELFAAWRGHSTLIGDPDEPTIDEWEDA